MNESETGARPRKPPRKRWEFVRFMGIGAGVLFLAPAIGVAEVALETSAYAQYEYDSNVFYLAPGVTFPGDSRSDPSDTVLTAGGKFVVAELWQQQKVYLSLQGSDYRYDHFTQLDHSDYTLDGDWIWTLGGIRMIELREMIVTIVAALKAEINLLLLPQLCDHKF